jgi:[ribosomal protein S18]-alanine N-acetyltransferase
MCPEDCIQVAVLHQYLDDAGWSESEWLKSLEHYPCSWVLADDNKIHSYICFQTTVSQAEILNLGVAAEKQGQGVAFELVLACIKLLPEYVESIFLEVRRSNIPAIGLYQKLGFNKVGERREYYATSSGIREDALIFKLDISL